jgi:hypothetical protein
MKKTVLSIFTLTTLLSFGQINITASDLPTVGTEVINLRDFNLSVDVGQPGANQVYDLSGLISTGEDTLTYLDPSQTIYSSMFPNASISMYTSTDSSYAFMKLNANDLSLTGMTMPNPLGMGENAVVKANDDLIQLTFPSTYLTTFTDAGDMTSSSISFYQEVSPSPLTYFDSIRAQVIMNRTSIIDGWGTLNTPFGTTFNVLRQVVTDIRTITPEFNMTTEIVPGFPVPLGYQTIPGTEITDTSITYYYLANLDGYQPMILAEIAQNGLGITTSIKYAKLPFLSVNEISNTSSTVIYPNPTSDVLNFNAAEKINKIEITSLDGKIVKEINANSNEVNINISELIAGNYFAKVYSNSNFSTHKVVKK